MQARKALAIPGANPARINLTSRAVRSTCWKAWTRVIPTCATLARFPATAPFPATVGVRRLNTQTLEEANSNMTRLKLSHYVTLFVATVAPVVPQLIAVVPSRYADVATAALALVGALYHLVTIVPATK